MTAVGDRFAGTRLQRVSVQGAAQPTPARLLCPDTDRPDHLWWGYHCRLDKATQPRYGLTCDDYHRLLAAQGGRCGVCGGWPGVWRLVVEHDHDPPYAVRGLVHFTCNRLLGFVGVLAWWLRQMARYLADPPGHQLGLRVPAAKVRRLEAKDAAKRRRVAARRAQTKSPPTDDEFARRVQAALEQTTKQGG